MGVLQQCRLRLTSTHHRRGLCSCATCSVRGLCVVHCVVPPSPKPQAAVQSALRLLLVSECTPLSHGARGGGGNTVCVCEQCGERVSAVRVCRERGAARRRACSTRESLFCAWQGGERRFTRERGARTAGCAVCSCACRASGCERCVAATGRGAAPASPPAPPALDGFTAAASVLVCVQSELKTVDGLTTIFSSPSPSPSTRVRRPRGSVLRTGACTPRRTPAR